MDQLLEKYDQAIDDNKSIWILGFVILLGVLVLITLVSVDRYISHKNEIIKLTNITANTAANEISNKLQILHEKVSEFSTENNSLLKRVYESKAPTSEENLLLKLAVSEKFPNSYFYAIADDAGENIFHAHGKEVGERCQLDIKAFAENNFTDHNLKIHSHKIGFHFDVMAPYITNEKDIGILFVGFLTDIITPILAKHSNNDYRLVLVSSQKQDLIEISHIGARDNSDKEKYLDENQLNRVLNTVPIGGALWQLDVIANESLFDNIFSKIIRDALLLFGIMLLICAPIFYILSKQAGKRRQVLDRLKYSEAKFYDLYERAPDMYITVNNQGKIQSSNKCARDYFGKSNDELNNANLMEVITPEDIEGVANHFQNVFEQNLPESEYECHTKDRFGNSKIMHARFSLSQHNLNEEPSVRIVCRDITEQRQLESERIQRIEKQRDTLVKEVHHRIKNNLQSVASLLKTYSRKYPELKDIVRDASSKINSIAEVYGLQSEGNDQNVYIRDLVNSIVNNETKLFLTNINLNADAKLMKNGLIAENEVTPIAVIISELVTNAIKYCSDWYHESNKVISIDLKKDGEEIVFVIKNGVDKNVGTINVQEGVGLGQGLSLIRALIPPKGVSINHEVVGKNMIVTLVLEYPVVIFGKAVEDSVDQCINTN